MIKKSLKNYKKFPIFNKKSNLLNRGDNNKNKIFQKIQTKSKK